MIVEVVASIARLPGSIAALAAVARAKQRGPLGSALTEHDAFRRRPGFSPPPMEAPSAAVVRARLPWVTLAIILVLVGVFIAERAMTPDRHDDNVSDETLIALGAFLRPLVLGGEVQRVLLSSLLHTSTDHLIDNCVVLAVAGWYLEQMAGHAWLGCVLGLGAIGGSVGSMLFTLDCVSAGASDAIMAVVAAAFIVSFQQKPTRERLIMRVLLLADALTSLTPPWDDAIDNGAHFGGLVMGLAIGWRLWRAWPADPARVPMRRLSRRLAAALTCALLLSSAAVARKFPHYQWAATNLIPIDEEWKLPDDRPTLLARSEALVAQYPNDPRAHLYWAEALADRDDLLGAERELRQALALTAGFEGLMGASWTTRLNFQLAATVFDEGRTTEARRIAHVPCGAISVMEPAEMNRYTFDRSWSLVCGTAAAARP
jgi:membrane associated rhomboid family serine protease